MKKASQSVTIWLNFIPTVVTVLTALSNDQLIANNPKLAAGIATALFVLNIANRFRTVEPISFK